MADLPGWWAITVLGSTGKIGEWGCGGHVVPESCLEDYCQLENASQKTYGGNFGVPGKLAVLSILHLPAHKL
jgi:hypothetical protein